MQVRKKPCGNSWLPRIRRWISSSWLDSCLVASSGSWIKLLLIPLGLWIARRLRRNKPCDGHAQSNIARKPSISLGSGSPIRKSNAGTSKRAHAELREQFGRTEDPFRLGSYICEGSFAAVYSCIRCSTGEEFAAKVIDSASLASKEVVVRETHIMRELHHPRIVNLHVVFWEENLCIIVMDLARGGDLFSKLNKELHALSDPAFFRRLGGSELIVKHISRQVLDGIGYMHRHRVIHRDLKLENILIARTYQASVLQSTLAQELHDIKIADFGLSRLHDIRKEQAPPLTPCGSPYYAAPEVLDGTYDERVDLWSFGVIVYCMLRGRKPFMVEMVLPGSYPAFDVSEPWTCFSEEVRDLVSGLLMVNPAERLSFDKCLRHAWFADTSLQALEAATTPLNARAVPSNRNASDPPVGETVGAVRQVSGRTGSGVHSLEWKLQNGSARRFGFEGGTTHWSWLLRPGELIIAVMQEICDTHLGYAMVFYTSLCRILALQGNDARRRNRFVAPVGYQIVGLQFEENDVTGVHIERAGECVADSVGEISGQVSSVVEQVVFKLRDGTSLTYGDLDGSEQGVKQGPFTLQPGEFIRILEQGHRDWKLGTGLVFYTSEGNVIKLSGMTAAPSRRFAAPLGHQGADLSASTCASRMEIFLVHVLVGPHLKDGYR
eukprot:TRINITY_DN19812_c0_g1_i1.p1 TRINITY_DN19812_c0_g1~~TRINITY_DN19812_c0_g1_i1.p1  ORF type:complete len:664 (+),score=60.13 TRINITY_DN19812_c0_g1_i1:79-2070(+)